MILLDSLSKNNSNNEDIMLEYDINQGWQLHIKDKIRELTKEPIYTLLKKILQEQIMKMISINSMWLLQELRKV